MPGKSAKEMMERGTMKTEFKIDFVRLRLLDEEIKKTIKSEIQESETRRKNKNPKRSSLKSCTYLGENLPSEGKKINALTRNKLQKKLIMTYER